MATWAGGRPPSPVDEILKNMNLTREDLARHSEQMRLFLTGGADCASSSTLPAQPTQPTKHRSKSRRLSSRSVSRSDSVVHCLTRAASPSPSRVCVKAEPVEEMMPTPPMRALSTMELVLERKSKQSRERRSSNTRSRDARRAQDIDLFSPSTDMTPESTPQTPHHFRHYSDRVLGDAFASRAILPPSGDDPRTPRAQSKAPGSSRAATPAGRTIYNRGLNPHYPSSPGSSPTRVINMVSSPGPMRSSPAIKAKKEKPPYVLPPGPYLEDKPDCAYAGLIGQAILSSPEHRLTLQDIYEWITTVYPYYKRGEQTWMNSVRHCLSTMAVFRKVPRVRNEGKSLWAVFDDDVAAFANGSFKKSLCADMVKQEKEKQAKRGPRKRGSVMDDGRDTKRHKGEHGAGDEGSRTAAHHPMLPPYFPPFHVNPNHQPYYQTYAPQAIPAEVVFPPLPPNAGFARAVSRPMSARPSSSAGSSAARPVSAAGSIATDTSIPRGRDRSPKPISSSSSVPALTPNCSSSSSPPLPSHTSLADDARYSSSPGLSSAYVAIADSEDDEESELGLGWMHSGPPIEALAPSATLLKPADFSSSRNSKSKQRDARKRYKALSARPTPESPTLEYSTLLGKRKEAPRRDPITPPPVSAQLLPLPSTPPNRLCTPPRKQRVTSGGVRLSPTLTPISHAGLHMSPSPSLAHYKSHLDPPPPAPMHFPQAPLLAVPGSSQMTPPRSTGSTDVHTPLRKVSDTSDFLNLSPFAPMTPQRLTYPNFDSPWRTPSRNAYDLHGTSSLLDDEFHKQSLKDISPSLLGLSGRPRGLWDSPLGSSPSIDRFWG